MTNDRIDNLYRCMTARVNMHLCDKSDGSLALPIEWTDATAKSCCDRLLNIVDGLSEFDLDSEDRTAILSIRVARAASGQASDKLQT